MIVCKLSISYDRGLARNHEKDLAADENSKILGRGQKTADGKVIRGVGTHFRSEKDAQLVSERDKETCRIYRAFRQRFLTTPIDGLYAVPAKGAAKAFLEDLDPQLGIEARVTEFEITTSGDMDAAEIMEWSNRIKRQLSSVSLGRTKEIDEDGLSALATLASCPVISEDTKQQIESLVDNARAQKISRVDLKRNLEILDVQIEMTSLAPRRVPKLAEVA